MVKTMRFGVSLPGELLAHFDETIKRRHYKNRSEAIRDLIRGYLVEADWGEDRHVVGTIILVYEHHRRELAERLIEIQHSHHSAIISALHIHLDEDRCLEVLVARGKSARIRKLADELISLKGVIHGRLTQATAGAQLK